MKYSTTLLVIAALNATAAFAQADTAATTGTPAAAQQVAAIKKGAMIYSSDGRRLGRVEYVRADHVGVIHDGHFVNVPLSTLTGTESGYKSSASRSELQKR